MNREIGERGLQNREAWGHPGPRAQVKGMWWGEGQEKSRPAVYKAGMGVCRRRQPTPYLGAGGPPLLPPSPAPEVGEKPGPGPGCFLNSSCQFLWVKWVSGPGQRVDDPEGCPSAPAVPSPMNTQSREKQWDR